MSETWLPIADFPLAVDLSALNQRLRDSQISHRFTEENGLQRLWVSSRHNSSDIEDILYGRNQGHTLKPSVNSTSMDLSVIYRHPISVLLMLMGALGYAAVFFNLAPLLNTLAFLPFFEMSSRIEYWRIVSPAFLHFGVLHFVFNALWIWVIGARLEAFLGWRAYVLLFLFSASLSNSLQYFAVKSILFGGLSGVVYAFLGCNFILSKRTKSDMLSLPPGIYGFMLVSLVLGFSGVIDHLIAGSVANWAHLGGLIAGIIFGFVYSVLIKRNRQV